MAAETNLQVSHRFCYVTRKSTMAASKVDFRGLILDSAEEALPQLLQTEHSPLNKWQCQHVQQKLCEVRHLVKSYTGDRSSGALKELYRNAKEAEDLVRQCCSQPWMRAAIAQADNREAFCEVLYDLEWCVTLLQSADPRTRLRGVQWRVQLAKRLTEIRLTNADAARKDREELEVRLKGAIQGVELRHDDLILANYLLARLTDDGTASKGVVADRIRGEFCGSGAYGEVYKILWLGETYAEKVFDLSRGERFKTSFEREGRSLRSLRHRNIVQLIDHFSSDRECSLVMEFMSRGDLKLLINTTTHLSHTTSTLSPEVTIWPPFSLDVAVDIVVQLAKGMQYMHDVKGVAHRDIKAGNVLVSSVKSSGYFEAEHERAFGGYLTVKLADFGMAKVKQESSLQRNSKASNIVGTIRWTAPELLDRNNQNLSPKSTVDPFAADVYSFGITCWEVVTGQDPFPGPGVSDHEVAYRVIEKGERPLLPGANFPPALAFLISKCWSAEPADRPSAGDIVRYLIDFKASLLQQAEFDYLSWSWNFDPGSIAIDDLSSSGIDGPENSEPEEVKPSLGESVGGSLVSKLLLRVKDALTSWLSFGGNIGSSTVEITSNDLETKKFPFEKLQAATNNFRKDVFIGQGPFAEIFRGSFTGGLKEAAVRELVFARNSDSQVFRERVSVMATIKHPNLINLVGYCENEGHFYLVHEFIDTPGTIGSVLLGFRGKSDALKDVTWIERYRIAVGVGQALVHLNEYHNPPIIHGNLTTRSIMLEEPDLKPRLFDFGMKFLFPEMDVDNRSLQFPSFLDEKMEWTAPEHKAGSPSTEKTPESDVYNFGILMLVLVSGRKVIQLDKSPILPPIIDVACKIYNEGLILSFLDRKVPARYSVPSEEVMLIMQVALLCLQENPQQRPKASEAVQMLLREVPIAPDRLRNITARIKLKESD